MTPVYLTGIELSDFRAFAHLQIELAPEPGVLIVHGSNGLGKSSLFDAIEWTLTGNIDHFTSVDGYEKFGNYLCRWGERPDPTAAALNFSDGNRIERQLAGREAKVSKSSGVPDIAEYLRAPDWEQSISALSRYLLLTHFLGQSTISRLTHRKPNERLEILRDVAQSAALQKFGLALHGPGQTLPARAFAKRIALLRRDVKDLTDALSQEETLWSGAQASGAVDDAAASALTTDLKAALDAAWSKIVGSSAPVAWDVLPDPAELQAAIDQTDERARARELAIAEARRLLAIRDRHRRILAEAAAAQAVAERELAAAEAAAAAAQAESLRLRQALEAVTPPLSATRSVHADLLAFQQVALAREAAAKDLEQVQVDLAQARIAVAKAQRDVQRGNRRTLFLARLRQELAGLEETLSETRSLIDRGREWLTRYGQLEKAESELGELLAHHPDIDAQISIASSTLTTAQSVEAAAREMLGTVERSVGAMSSAVATIAAHLSSESHDCPVCATHFPVSEDLSARAGEAAKRLAPLVAAQQKVVSDAQAAVATATTALQQFQSLTARRDALVAQRDADRRSNELLAERFGMAAPALRSSVEPWLADHLRAEAGLARSQRVRARWLERLSSNRQASAIALEATRRQDEARLTEAALARRADECVLAERVADERFTALASRLFSDEPPMGDLLHQAIVNAATSLAEAQKTYDEAATAQAEQGLRLVPLLETEANLRARIGQVIADQSGAQAELTSLPEQWRTAGWGDEDLDEAKIEAAASNLNQARQSLAEADGILRRLRDGREAWSRQLAHRDAIERLRTFVDLAPNATREQVRVAVAAKLAKQEAEATATTQSKEVASKASDLIASAVTNFNAAYLDPLKKLTNRINQAILCDPRIGIGLKLQRRGIKQSASVAGEMPEDLNNVDPLLVHSEGQMAALAVSLLCASSLTYPWSRWRALILDDPLQHNDAIHASAFADFIGNIVRVKNYQVLITTHELSQADFLQRKFSGRSIPCAVLDLLGRGNNGVDWAFRPSSNTSISTAAIA